MKKLSIIIVNYNTSLLLDKCLASIEKAIFSSKLSGTIEVVVVDNASLDDSVGMIKRKYQRVKLIRNTQNLGFAKANNQGIIQSHGKYVLLLNSDTRLDEHSLHNMLEAIESASGIGVLGPKLLNSDGSIQQSMGYFPNLFKVFAWMIFLDDLPIICDLIKPYHIVKNHNYLHPRFVDWVSGACILVNKEAIDKAGLLDEKIFMYTEEVEWCFRIKKAGYQALYLPSVQVYHDKGGSAVAKEIAGIAEEFLGILYFYHKQKPWWQNRIVKLFLLLGALLRQCVFGIINRNSDKAKSYAKAFQMVGR